MKQTIRLGVAGILAAALSGCGAGADSGRQAITGSVSMDGQPLNDGSLTLVPLGDGPTVGATIADGRFAIARDDGPLPGSYRAEVRAIRATGRKIPDPEGGKGAMMEERRDVVPPRFGGQSELRAEVTKGGANDFRFEVDTKPNRR